MTTVSQDTLDAFKRQARPWLVELIRNTAPTTGSTGSSSVAGDHPPATGGPGILVDINQVVSLGTPSTVSAASSNTVASATHTHAVASEYDVSAGASALLRSNAGNLRLASLHAPTLTTASGDQTASPVGNLVLTPGGFVRLTDGKTFRTATFSSGFTGAGFRLDQGVAEAGKTTFEVDNLWVRGRMHVYELLIHQIRATNGSIFVSNTGKASVVTYVSGADWNITTDPEHGFAVGDLIRAQRWTGTGTYQCNMRVKTVSSTTQFVATYQSGNSPAVGMEFVRLGSDTDTGRQGGIYLTADDSGAPYIDIFNGVNSFATWNTAGVIKGRFGHLGGLGVGSAGEYGLYLAGASAGEYLLVSPVQGVNLATAGGNVRITQSAGIEIEAPATGVAARKIKFVAGGVTYGELSTVRGTDTYVTLGSTESDTTKQSRTQINAVHSGVSSGIAYASIGADGGGSAAQVFLACNSQDGNSYGIWQGTSLMLNGDVMVGGSSAPSSRLHVKGASAVIRLAGTLTNQNLQMQFYDNDATLKGSLLYSGGGGAGFKYFGLYNSNADFLGFFSDGSHRWLTAGATELMRLDGTGLGIGTAGAPSEKLHVSGKVLAQQMQVTADSGGTAGRVSFVNATSAVSSGNGTVKMAGVTARNSDLWLKIYVGTTAYYLPAWSTIN